MDEIMDGDADNMDGAERPVPQLYREIGGLDRLVILDTPEPAPGMVMVARDGEDYEHRPELRWRVPRDRLVPMDGQS